MRGTPVRVPRSVRLAQARCRARSATTWRRACCCSANCCASCSCRSCAPSSPLPGRTTHSTRAGGEALYSAPRPDTKECACVLFSFQTKRKHEGQACCARAHACVCCASCLPGHLEQRLPAPLRALPHRLPRTSRWVAQSQRILEPGIWNLGFAAKSGFWIARVEKRGVGPPPPVSVMGKVLAPGGRNTTTTIPTKPMHTPTYAHKSS